MEAILLAAGRSTRMWPLCGATPKPLLAVAGRSLLARNLDALRDSGVTRVVIVVSAENQAAIRKEAKAWGDRLELVLVKQASPRGTGDAVATASRKVKDDCLLVMGDALVDAKCLAKLATGTGFIVAAAKVADGSQYGVLSHAGQKVTGLVEKPKRGGPALANAGIYRVPVEALAQARALKSSPRGELEFTDVVAAWAKRGLVKWVSASGWLDVGRPWDLLAAGQRLVPVTLDALLGNKKQGGPGTIEPGVQVRGRLFVEAGAIVRSGVYVEGDVHVAAGAKVGPNAYLRGPLSIGPECHVGAGCEVKASVLLWGAKVPHLSCVGDSVLGEACNLGAGTLVANLRHDGAEVRVMHRGQLRSTGLRKFGVIVGDGAKTGINTTLLPGTILGVGAWTAAGAVVRGTLDDAARP